MKKMLIKASLAGAAAIALAAGGTTFASLSDYGVDSSTAGAGIMQLTVSSTSRAGGTVKPFQLQPGDPELANKFQEFYLRSADADNVPNGTLTMSVQHVVDTGDAPANECTTQSEAIAVGYLRKLPYRS